MTGRVHLWLFRISVLLVAACAATACSDDGATNVEAVEVHAAIDVRDWEAAAESATESAVAKGERLFQMCTNCHGSEEGEPSPAGPSLYGITGRRVGSLESYPYTQALASQTVSWSVKQFDEFITSPQGVFPGTGMAYSGLKSSEDRDALIAFLATKSLKN